MKISKITIDKFRSIKKATFSLNNITAIVGENNAGKTGVLRAINSVLNFENEQDDFSQKNHQYSARSNTYITVTFTSPPDSPEYENYLYNNELTIKFSFQYSTNKKKYFVIKERTSIPIDDDTFKALTKDITYVYIPAGRTTKDITWSNDSILKDLILKYTAQYTSNRDGLSVDVKKAAEKIRSRVLVKLQKKLNQLYMQDKIMDFSIKFPLDLDYKILLDKIEISLNANASDHLLKEWGSGTKSLAIIAIYRAIASLDNGSIILGLEEPETNLHPQAQKRLIMSLRDETSNIEAQTIFSTHSPVLIDELSILDIILVRRDYTLEKITSNIAQVSPTFFTDHSLKDYQFSQFFYTKNSDFFFSKYVIVGESKNDCQVFIKLIQSEIKDKLSDISFLSSDGVNNMQYIYFLLKELKIPFIIIVDKDFFFKYSQDTLANSRSPKNGLPLYSSNLNHNIIIDSIFSESVKQKILNHSKNHTDFLSIIAPTTIISMHYCLEMDLTCSSKARDVYYKQLSVPNNKRTQKILLTEYSNSIKKISNILGVLNEIPVSSYPKSYLSIKRRIIKDINKYIK